MIDALEIERQRRPESDGVTERMEEWQDPDDHIFAAQVNDLIDGFGVRSDVVECQHHAFGSTRGSGRENHGQYIVPLDLAQTQLLLEPTGGCHISSQCRRHFVRKRRFVLKVFEIDKLRVEIKVHFAHEAPTGEHMFDPGRRDALIEHI